ncbi:MAG: radical SAM family heme chaperone HemW [Alphaproteobacteria bacterium]|nr:radical SAM family heme chaperone HemW [Alphaproteobacteria bacterium]
MPRMSAPHNIYIHVPFCASKCNYCAFYSAAIKPDWQKYATEICKELDYWAEKLGRITVPTIFFGGGTPSLMPTEVFSEILEKANSRFHIPNNAEITIEANPGTLAPTKLNDFIALGLNRLSVGAQSLDDTRLAFLGRRHTAADARALLAFAIMRNIRVSADFIYGLPGDTAATVKQMCMDINSLGLKHCSLYELTIEPHTPFGKMNLKMPSNTDMAEMYSAISETLALSRYEVSNYAAPGHECRHNLNIWDGDAYIGIGRGAAGRVLLQDTWYEQMGAGAIFSPISTEARAAEKIITGMRTRRGVKITPDVKAAINWDWVQQNPSAVRRNDDRLCATDSGLLTLDSMLVELIR